MSKLLTEPKTGYVKPKDDASSGVYPKTLVEGVYWAEKKMTLADVIRQMQAEIESGGGSDSSAPYVQYRGNSRTNPEDNKPWSFGEAVMAPKGYGDNIDFGGEVNTVLDACFDFKIVTELPVSSWEVNMIDDYLMYVGFLGYDGEQANVSEYLETQSKEVTVNIFTYGTPESGRKQNCKFLVTIYFGEQNSSGSLGSYTFTASVPAILKDK